MGGRSTTSTAGQTKEQRTAAQVVTQRTVFKVLSDSVRLSNGQIDRINEINTRRNNRGKYSEDERKEVEREFDRMRIGTRLQFNLNRGATQDAEKVGSNTWRVGNDQTYTNRDMARQIVGDTWYNPSTYGIQKAPKAPASVNTGKLEKMFASNSSVISKLGSTAYRVDLSRADSQNTKIIRELKKQGFEDRGNGIYIRRLQ